MSSHREAPEISTDPVADSTDVYAFVSPDRPNTVTLIANYIPLQGPAGGPNFYQFGDSVRYAIHIDTHGNSEANITYEFDFRTDLADKDTFLYNTGPITSLTSAELEPQAAVLGHQGGPQRPARTRPRPALPAVQHRAAVHAELRVSAREPGHSQALRRQPCLRRAARRGLLRGPRLDL